MNRSEKGFTLLELLIVVAVIGITMAVTADMAASMINQFKTQGKIFETKLDGMIGLEFLRQDMERAGYGLPWIIPPGITYAEAAAADYNDTLHGSAMDPPRAIVSGPEAGWIAPDSGVPGSDYLVIKAANIPRNAVSQKWAYLTSKGMKTWGESSEDAESSDYVVVLSPGNGQTDMRTLQSANGSWKTKVSGLSSFRPGDGDPQPLLVYGISDSDTSPRMPFNRSDYYLLGPGSSTNIPARCAPNTGILVKSMISHSDGKKHEVLPLLDCVADMKVLFRLDRNGDGTLTATDVLNDTEGSPLTALQIRQQVKEITVYILSHEGQNDRSFTYPRTTITVGAFGLGHEYAIGRNVHYRWKVYAISVQPKNLGRT